MYVMLSQFLYEKMCFFYYLNSIFDAMREVVELNPS